MVANWAPRTGTNSNAMASDAVKVASRVIGINFMNSPTRPGQNNNGAKAARVVAVDAVIGHAIRFAARAKALLNGSPSRILRSAYSVTTMAPSTSMPTERIRENSTTMFTVRPSALRTRIAVRNDPGMAMATRMPERRPSAATTAIITRRTALKTLFCRSRSMSLMRADLSCENVTVTVSGQAARSTATASRTLSTVSIMFSPVRFEISSVTAG